MMRFRFVGPIAAACVVAVCALFAACTDSHHTDNQGQAILAASFRPSVTEEITEIPEPGSASRHDALLLAFNDADRIFITTDSLAKNRFALQYRDARGKDVDLKWGDSLPLYRNVMIRLTPLEKGAGNKFNYISNADVQVDRGDPRKPLEKVTITWRPFPSSGAAPAGGTHGASLRSAWTPPMPNVLQTGSPIVGTYSIVITIHQGFPL